MKRRVITLLLIRLLILLTIWPMVQLSSVNNSEFDDPLFDKNCTLKVNNFERVKQLFKTYTTERNAESVEFRIYGVEWSDSFTETIEVFDPNVWSWVAKDRAFLTQMPIDYHILSFGISISAIMRLEANVADYPYGCLNSKTFKHQKKMVMKEFLRLMDGVTDENDLICRSTYSHLSLITGKAVGVGKTCCTRGELLDDRPAKFECSPEQAAFHEVDGFSQRYTLMAIFAIVFPVAIIIFELKWLKGYQQISFREDVTVISDNKLQKWVHFSLIGNYGDRSSSSVVPETTSGHNAALTTAAEGGDTGTTILIAEDDLVSYEGQVHFNDIFGLSAARYGKLKIAIFLTLHIVLVVYWLIWYGLDSVTLQRLDSSEKIIFNLYRNPYCWVWTDNSLWLHYCGTLVVFFDVLLTLVVMMWLVFESQCFRQLFANEDAGSEQHPRRKKVNEKDVFKGFFYVVLTFSLVPAFSTFHSITYVVGSLIAHINKTFAWLAFAILLVCYLRQTVMKLKESYTEIKRSIFKVCTEIKVKQARQIARADIKTVNYNSKHIKDNKNTTTPFSIVRFSRPVLFTRHRVRCQKCDYLNDNIKEDMGTERARQNTPERNVQRAGRSIARDDEIRVDNERETSFQTESIPRPVLFIKYQVKCQNCNFVNIVPEVEERARQNMPKQKKNTSNYEGGIASNYMLDRSVLRGLFKRLKPLRKTIKEEAIQLGLTFIFSFLVAIIMISFQPNEGKTSAITVLQLTPPLLIALIHWFVGKTITEPEADIRKDIVDANVYELLTSCDIEYKVKCSHNDEAGVEV